MKLLRETIRRLILEALKFDGDTPEGLMLLKDPAIEMYVLCRGVSDRQYSKILGPDGSLRVHDTGHFYTNHVLGMIHFSDELDYECYGALEVKKSAARDGWGPTMYDIVMEITDKPLINDRFSVTDEAEEMMSRYRDRDDVEKKLMDNVHDKETYPVTPETFDDCDPGSGREYENGMGGPFNEFWEDDPLSYAYNKPMSSKSQDILAKGTRFMTLVNAGSSEVRKLANSLFKELYL